MSSAFFPTQLHIGGSLDLHSIKKKFASKATLKDLEAADAENSEQMPRKNGKSPNNIIVEFTIMVGNGADSRSSYSW